MPFDPDKYLASKTSGFNPDAYLAERNQPRSWGETAVDAVSNFVPSLGGVAKDIYGAASHPIDTSENLLRTGFAGAVKALPKSAEEWMVEHANDPEKFKESLQMAENVGEFYKDRYGSEEGFKKALAEDPASVMMDASVFLSGGAGAASKLGLAKTGQALSKAGAAVNPFSLAAKGAKAGYKAARNTAGGAAGLMTGSVKFLEELHKAGRKSKQATITAIDNMRGRVPSTDALLDVQDGINAMKRIRSKEYEINMASTKSNVKPLKYTDIDNAIADAERSVINSKGFVKNQKAVDLINDIKETVVRAKAKKMNTAAEFDDLKQAVNAVIERYGYENPSATRIGTQIYNSVKGTIVKQSPEYAKAMRNYEEATDILNEIKRTLSQNRNASVDTQMRKLQSLMRNDVSTNYGSRTSLVNEIEAQSGKDIMPALAGQYANTWLPRGLARAVAGAGASGSVIGGAAMSNPATMLSAIPIGMLSSPRLMGETAVKVGQLERALMNAGSKAKQYSGGIDPNLLSAALYQMNQPKEMK